MNASRHGICDCIHFPTTATHSATAIIQGFGNVGSYAAIELAQRGVKVIGVSDHTSCYFDKRGLDVDALVAHAAKHGSLKGFSTELTFDPSQLLIQSCDILVPAAVERVIDADIAAKLDCRILAEAANGPTTATFLRLARPD